MIFLRIKYYFSSNISQETPLLLNTSLWVFILWFEICRTFADDFLQNIVIPTFGPRWQIPFGWKTRTDLSVKIISFPSPMNKFKVHSIFSLRTLLKEYNIIVSPRNLSNSICSWKGKEKKPASASTNYAISIHSVRWKSDNGYKRELKKEHFTWAPKERIDLAKSSTVLRSISSALFDSCDSLSSKSMWLLWMWWWWECRFRWAMSSENRSRAPFLVVNVLGILISCTDFLDVRDIENSGSSYV